MLHFWAILFCFTWVGAVPLTEEQVSSKGPHSKVLEPRITFGHKAEMRKFSWQVYILSKLFDGDFFECGGSLIKDQWILTAAHCLKDTVRVYICLGTAHIEDKSPYLEDCNRRVFLSSKNLYVHPKYDGHYLNDIALIKLKNPVIFSRNIKRIKLINEPLPSGSKVFASGWGRTHKGKASNDLLYAKMTTLPIEKCFDEWLPGTLCAVAEGKKRESTCVGDSGGPLVYHNETSSKYFLVGVLSYGLGGHCKVNDPEYFSDVYQFRNWIYETIENY